MMCKDLSVRFENAVDILQELKLSNLGAEDSFELAATRPQNLAEGRSVFENGSTKKESSDG